MSPGKFFAEIPFGKRQRTIEATRSANIIQRVEGEGKLAISTRYGFLDSPLDENEHASMNRSFENILPSHHHLLREYIEEILAERKGTAIGVEFGGIGVRLFDGFSKGFFQKSAGVTLVDHRTEGEVEEDTHTHPTHQVLTGNLLVPATYEKLTQALGVEKVDFIIERLALGWELIPQDPYTLAKVLQIWYGLLNEGGIMLVQTDRSLSKTMDSWALMIERDYKDLIDFQYHRIHPRGVFRLRKLRGAPRELPLLSPRTIRQATKQTHP